MLCQSIILKPCIEQKTPLCRISKIIGDELTTNKRSKKKKGVEAGNNRAKNT
jgi:hypothetical protein